MDVMEQIEEQIGSNTILLYMKGSPKLPQCGFSSKAVQALIGCGEQFAFGLKLPNSLPSLDCQQRLETCSSQTYILTSLCQ